MVKRRVVITGLGMVTPLGLTTDTTWSAILQGKSGVAPITHFDASAYATQVAAEVKNFDPTVYLTAKEARKFDPFVQYAMAAAKQAMDDAKLIIDNMNCHRTGVAIGSGIGGLSGIEKSHQALLESGPRRISPFFIPGCIINMAAGLVSMQFNLRGPNISIVSACTTGAHNIGYAARTIAYGDADIMVAGGTEMATCPLGIGGFVACRAMTTRNDEPTRASRPWDKDRDGFVLGDGAGVLILEEYHHAKKRGARIYAELIGFGMSADAYHITSPLPEGQGFVASMQNALQDADISPEQVNYINAHGTSTPTGDEVEAKAIKAAFGMHAKRLAVSSTKSMTGHLIGAAGAVEAIFSVLAIRDQIAPPTINLDHPSDNCDLDFVPHQARPMPIHICLSNSFGFGGTNGTLAFSRLSG